MWMNFLLRTYAWMTLLEKNGLINKFFDLFGLGPFNMINTSGAVVLGMVYNYLPFMILPIYTAMTKIDDSIIEAAQDLGCTPRQAFTKVIMPQLSPAILSAFLICLTYSIDDFMISYFNSGTMQTLPIAIYSMTRKKVSPEINALSAVIFCVILAIILISNAADSRAYRRNQKAIRKAMLDEGGR